MRASELPRFRVAAAVVLAAAVLAVFWPVLSAGFVNYDDPHYVLRNPHVREGFTSDALGWAWSATYSANWHPLTWMSHVVDWSLFDGWAPGHHAVSVLLHAVNAVLLFLLLERLTSASWRSGVAAAMFAVHPLHVESVAWISERKDVLSALFGLLALLAYARYAKSPSLGRMAAVAFPLAAGLLAKPMLVTLPFAMLLLDAWPLERLATGSLSWPAARPLLIEKLPLFALAAASSIATYLVQSAAEATALTEKIGFPFRAANAVVSVGAYLVDMVWPSGLAVFYPHPGRNASLSAVAAATAALLGLSLAAAWLRRSRPYLMFGWLWYLGMLVPVLGLVQVGSQARADRYTYLPLVGIFVAAAWGCADALDAPHRRRGVPARAPDSPARLWPLIAALPLLAFAARTQAATWSDSVKLWTHALAVTGPNAEAHVNLGHALAERGDLGGAEAQYRAALALGESHPDALNGLGLVLLRRRRLDEALPLFQRAVASRPSFADAHANLAAALASAGRPDEALSHALTAARLAPDVAEVRANAGALLLRAGRLGEAIDQLAAALRLDPASPGTYANLAAGCYLAGRYGDAWRTIALARRRGFEPPARLVADLTARMPDPSAGTGGRDRGPSPRD